MIRERVDRARANPVVRKVAQALIICLLLAAGWTFNDRISTTESETAAINGVLARSCGAATFEELRAQGLVEECRLAQQGMLAESIPDSALPDPSASPDEVIPDVVKDDETSTPADVQPTIVGPTDAQVAAKVDDYFDQNPLVSQPGYQRAIRRTVSVYLTANPPSPGRPPTQREIAGAVRAALLANPPSPGADGAAGRGVTATALDNCDIVFTFSDGTNTRVGPVCGKDGQPGPAPTDNQIAQAVAAYCTANGECRGPAGPAGPEGPIGPTGGPGVVQTLDNCTPPPGEVVVDVEITGPAGDPLTITLSCTTAPGVVTPGSAS